jgi:hypothetical protein
MTTRGARKNPWSIKLDYDKEILQDEQTIAETTRALEHGWFVPVWHPPLATIKTRPLYEGESEFSDSCSLLDLFLLYPEFAYDAGFTDEDLGVLVHTLDGYEHARYDGFPVPTMEPAVWKRSDSLLKQITELWPSYYLYSEDALRKQLKHAKTALSRHKRNKGKYGHMR